jgi:hypothetical protein
MQLDPEKQELVASLARQILEALASASEAAREALYAVRTPDVAGFLAVHTNTLVHGSSATARRFSAGEAERRLILERLIDEPFVARVSVSWERESDDRETIYVARSSSPGFSKPVHGATVVNYRAAYGRLAEAEAGDSVTLQTPGGTRKAFVHERVRLRPTRSAEVLDGLDDSIEFDQWSLALESLIRFLAEVAERPPVEEEVPDLVGTLLQQGAAARLVLERMRRRVVDRMSLRDQPVLDKFQGEIFRLPVDRRLVLLGPPGTGKTTTLIRRLAQKRTADSLSEDEEEALERAGVRGTLSSSTWAMFSPTELLKRYLREAFNREFVPASDDNLRTWEWQRLYLGRNVLGILRSATGGRFQLDESATTLLDPSSDGTVRLFEAFYEDLEHGILSRLTDSFEDLKNAQDAELIRLAHDVIGRFGTDEPASVSHLARILERGSQLQPVIKRLSDHVSEELQRITNRLLFKHKTLLSEIVAQLPIFQAAARGDDEDDDADDTGVPPPTALQTVERQQEAAIQLLMAALRLRARSAVRGQTRVGGRAGRLLAFLGDRVPADDEFVTIGDHIAALAQARAIVGAPRQFVMSVPAAYARFRSTAIRDDAFFQPEMAEAFREGKIAPDEVDIVILAMLRNARRLFEGANWVLLSGDVPEWLNGVRREYLTQVFVDEATDFSALQLACTMELSHPRLHSWFACGDFNQRITEHGISNQEGLDWLARGIGKSFEVQHVRIGYRQSRRLRELVAALTLESGSTAPDPPEHEEEADVWPILVEDCSEERLAEWLAARIVEIESAIAQLPSIAVFVDSDAQIDPLVNRLRTLLASQNVQVVGCHDGRDVGNEQEVRVFDVRHIKGLEFEAVFFVGIDRLATSSPDLFLRFFYVGASRAATYLGVACDNSLPTSLDSVREHFSTGDWSHA